LAENIYVAGEMGAEFSPIHLHALPKVRQLNGIDVILAGSYGDSIGRGEYSGRRIHQLRPIVPPFLNRFRLLKGEVVRASRASVLQDAYGYRQETERKARCQYRELEHAMHYMRRKLQVCMSYVADRIPLFQLFTAPETFGLMWSLAPSIRDDRFYAALLPSLPGAIATLPWSRTGQPLGRSEGDKAAGSAVFHEYGTWLRRDLRTMIIQLVTSDTIKQLNVFNELALKRIVKLWPRATTTTTNSIDETLSWMASLAVFIDRYGIQPPDGAPASWCGALDALLGEAWAWGYQSARGRLRQ
jgi:asparagine synthase (glutamine-hydrolysing)